MMNDSDQNLRKLIAELLLLIEVHGDPRDEAVRKFVRENKNVSEFPELLSLASPLARPNVCK